MSKIKLKLYKSFPNLFISDIRKIATDYHDKKGWGYFSQDKDKLTVLEQILPEVASDRFFKVLYEDLRCRLNFDPLFTPDIIANNPKIIDLAIKYDPLSALNVPNRLLTDEHLKIVEDYIKEYKHGKPYIHRVPKKFANSDILFEAYINTIFYSNSYVDFFQPLRTYLEYPDRITRILNEIDKLFDDPEKSYSCTYGNAYGDIWYNDTILNYFINKDNSYIQYIPKDLTDKVLEIISKQMIEGTFDYSAYNMGYFNILYDSELILKTIFKLNKIDEYQLIILRSKSTSLNYIQLVKLFEYNMNNGKAIRPIDWEKDPNFLHIFINNPDLRPTDINMYSFKKEAFDETIIRDFVNNINNLDYTEVAGYMEFLGGNKDAVNAYINYLITKYDSLPKSYYVVPLNCLRNPSVITDESMQLIIEYLKKALIDNPNIKVPLTIELLSDERFTNLIIDNKLVEYYTNLPQETYLKPEVLNKCFRTLDFNTFINDSRVCSKLDEVINIISIEDIEDFKYFFNRLETEYNHALALLVVTKYKNSGLHDSELDIKVDNYIEYIKNRYLTEFKSEEANINLFIEQVLEGKRNPFTALHITTKAALSIAANYSNNLTNQVSEKVNDEHYFIYENINKKHIRDIMTLLEALGLKDYNCFDIAIKMYAAIGYNRAKDLLNPNPNKNYGPVSSFNIMQLFSSVNLTGIPLVRVGKSYSFEENKFLINLLMGANYKDKTSLIHQYLTDFEDKKKEINGKIDKVNAHPNLNEEEKKSKIERLEEELSLYRAEIDKFVRNFGQTLNTFDVIEEEFIKTQAKSKMQLKLNMAFINASSGIVKEKRSKPKLEPRDILLEKSDVFDYVGYDTQYTSNPAQAPARAIELSRRMDCVKKKKFPNIRLEKDGYELFVYEPHDRRIISAGYRSGCCFRPNGNADNSGQDNSLLNYCVSTEYGGGVEVRNPAGETVMFSPLLRNGNVLMVHSIETKHSSDEKAMTITHQLLQEFASKTIEESRKHGDEIDFVTITALHYLKHNYTKGTIPQEKRFDIHNVDNKFDGMYNNLSTPQMILGIQEGKTINDIKYGSVDVSYDYPTVELEFFEQYSSEEREIITIMKELQDRIIELSNERYEAKKKGDYELSNIILTQIKESKKEFLKFYKKSLDARKGIDIFERYKENKSVISNINERLGISFNTDISEIYSGPDWYILITPNNEVIANALESGQVKLQEELEKLERLRGTLNIVTPEELNQGMSL